MFLPMLGPKAMLVVQERRPNSSTSVAPVAGSVHRRVVDLEGGLEAAVVDVLLVLPPG